MDIHYTQIDNLPLLVWLAEIKNRMVEVIHGTKVEIIAKWFINEIWTEEFVQGDFPDNGCFAKLVQGFVWIKSFFTNSYENGLFAKNIRG